MKACPKGAIVNTEELIVLERACALAVKMAEAALRTKTVAPDRISAFKGGMRIYSRYVRMIQRVRKANSRA
jgi:hypothetical protein